MYHGYGEFKDKDGAVYNGMWLNNKRHGMGKEILPDGSEYNGMFYAGVKEG